MAKISDCWIKLGVGIGSEFSYKRATEEIFVATNTSYILTVFWYYTIVILYNTTICQDNTIGKS